MHPDKVVRVWLSSEYRRKLKERCVAYKGGKCERCGYDKSVAAMDFHHLEPSEKDFGVSSGTYRRWSTIVKELNKCALLCANCHREEHERLRADRIAKQGAFARQLAPAMRPSVTVPCAHCGAGLVRAHAHRDRRTFCDKKCRDDFRAAHVRTTAPGAGTREPSHVCWPTNKLLAEMLLKMPATDIARELGVSSSAVKKRCKKFGISTPPRGYWSTRSAGSCLATNGPS